MSAPAEEVDTDTKLALLASLLEPATFPAEAYIEALTEAGGDVGRAAESLLLPRVRSAGKRKAGTSLQSWFIKKKVYTDTVEEEIVSEDVKPVLPTRPTTDLMSLLKQPTTPPKTKIKATPQPALNLTSQTAIDHHHLPLTLLGAPLSPSFASALYLAMMDESDKWERHQWYLAGKWVESPHLMSGYRRENGGFGDEADKAKYYYSGSELPKPGVYPEMLRRAAEIVEDAVNDSLEKRKRFPLEWAGRWKANVCGANRYDGASSGVGWHADQLTCEAILTPPIYLDREIDLGPYCTIASLSLGTPRAFRLRQTDSGDTASASAKPIRTYEVTLGHNSLVLMTGGSQERYKHTVPTQKALDLFRPAYDIGEQSIPLDQQKTYTTRINITFRFYREDFHPLPSTGTRGPRQGTPVCKCGMPALLRADQKAKARSRLPPSPIKNNLSSKGNANVVKDDMLFFWQCQSPGQTGDMKGCGFFKVLDMEAEGRGPCFGD